MDKIKILCAEDHPMTMLAIKEKMEAKGWEVIEAMDGMEAFEKYKQCKPDLIVLDVDMPRWTGLEVLQVIRASDLFTPIVFFSSLADEEYVKAGLFNGANVYFTKNYSIDSLLLQVEKLLPDKSTEMIALAIGVTYNFISGELKINNRSEKLSGIESKVFASLCRNKNQLCHRDLLLQDGWNSIDVNLSDQLYKQIGKIKQKFKGAENIELVVDWGNGYYLKTK